MVFGGTIFLEQDAHVAILDGAGHIMAVNSAWERFGAENGLRPSYMFGGVDYLDVCVRAAAAAPADGTEGAAETVEGLRDVLASRSPRFSITYPCHAPHEQRWFLMFARPMTRGVGGAVVSHINVTSLKLAGLVPDEASEPAARTQGLTSGASELAASIAMHAAALETICSAVVNGCRG